LSVEYNYADLVRQTAQSRQPLARREGLPLFAATVVAVHDLGGRDADRVEEEAANAGNAARVERLNRGGLSTSRRR
jgi:hypothetical protein